WSTDAFVKNPNANAIRFGTLYNFRFDQFEPPQAASAVVGFFKTGDAMTVPIQAPPAGGTPTATPPATATPTATSIASATATATPTATGSPTSTPRPSPTPRVAPTPRVRPTPLPRP